MILFISISNFISIFNTLYLAFRTTEAECHEYLPDAVTLNILLFTISRFLTDYVNIVVTLFIFRSKRSRKSDASFKFVENGQMSRYMSEENILRPASLVSRASVEDSELSDFTARRDV